jgi:hypothetical protein
VEHKFFSSNKFNEIKKRQDPAVGIIQYWLDNVLMTGSMEPPYKSAPLQEIYNLKPL